MILFLFVCVVLTSSKDQSDENSTEEDSVALPCISGHNLAASCALLRMLSPYLFSYVPIHKSFSFSFLLTSCFGIGLGQTQICISSLVMSELMDYNQSLCLLSNKIWITLSCVVINTSNQSFAGKSDLNVSVEVGGNIQFLCCLLRKCIIFVAKLRSKICLVFVVAWAIRSTRSPFGRTPLPKCHDLQGCCIVMQIEVLSLHNHC